VFGRHDVLVHPEMPVLPPRIGEETVLQLGDERPYRLALIPFNSPWTLGGGPVASVPCGFVDGLPVGLAVAGAPSAEATVLKVAASYQSETDWHERRPPVAAAAV